MLDHFFFTQNEFSVAEAAGTVSLTIFRDQGVEGTVDLEYRCIDGTATGNNMDYTNKTGVLRFVPGQNSAEIVIEISDDDLPEAHFETFYVELLKAIVVVEKESYLEKIIPEASLGSPTKAEVQIYDFGDGKPFGLAETKFARGGGGDEIFLQGWSVVGNGVSNPVWIDPEGLYSVDQSFSGPSAPSQTVPQELAVENDSMESYAGKRSASMSELNHCLNVPYVNSFSEDAHHDVYDATVSADASAGLVFSELARGAVSSGVVDNFPQSEVTVSMWVRSVDVSTGGTLFSFVKNTGTPPPSLNQSSTSHRSNSLISERYQEIAIHDARSLRVTIRDYMSNEEDKLDLAHLSERDRRIVTGVGHLNDGSWHFLSVVWKSSDASLHVYVDSKIAFHTIVPGINFGHNEKFLLSSSGILAVGAAVRGDCAVFVYPLSPRGVCGFISGSEFIGSVQNVQVWGVALSAKQRELEMQWPFAITKPNALDELRIFWRFYGGSDMLVGPNGSNSIDNATGIVVRNLANYYRSGGDINFIPGLHDTIGLSDGLITQILPASTKSSHTHLQNSIMNAPNQMNLPDEAPCVEDEEWYFSAPESFLGDIHKVYDGTLEFMMQVAHSSGVPRDNQGFIQLKSSVLVDSKNSANISNGQGTEKRRRPLVIQYTMPEFLQTVSIDGGSWVHFVIVMREDFGWTLESGRPISPATMLAALSNVEEFLIRGDTAVCGADGSGQEVVYLQNITMRLP